MQGSRKYDGGGKPPKGRRSPPRSLLYSRKSAFTLVELLACIAIAGVLAVLVSAASGKFRSNSQAAKCVSNLRQLAVVNQTISQDRGGRFEHVFADWNVGNLVNWKSRVLALESSQSGINNITYCPSWNPEFATVGGSPNIWFGYGQDQGRMTNSYDPGANTEVVATPFPLQTVENASTFLLFCDSIARNPSVWTYNAKDRSKNYQTTMVSVSGRTPNRPAAGEEGAIHMRHNGKAHCVFLDGHVQAVNAQELRNILQSSGIPQQPFYYWDENLVERTQP